MEARPLFPWRRGLPFKRLAHKTIVTFFKRKETLSPWPHLRRHQGPAQARVPRAVVAEDDRELQLLLLAGACAPRGRRGDGGVSSPRGARRGGGEGAVAARTVVGVARRGNNPSALVDAEPAPSGDADLALRVEVGVPAAV